MTEKQDQLKTAVDLLREKLPILIQDLTVIEGESLKLILHEFDRVKWPICAYCQQEFKTAGETAEHVTTCAASPLVQILNELKPICETSGDVVLAINHLRGEPGSGHVVEIPCENDDPDEVRLQHAVDVTGDWTKWEARRFYGATLLAALQSACKAKAEFKP